MSALKSFITVKCPLCSKISNVSVESIFENVDGEKYFVCKAQLYDCNGKEIYCSGYIPISYDDFKKLSK